MPCDGNDIVAKDRRRLPHRIRQVPTTKRLCGRKTGRKPIRCYCTKEYGHTDDHSCGSCRNTWTNNTKFAAANRQPWQEIVGAQIIKERQDREDH